MRHQITVSIVSHRQNGMVNRLVRDINHHCTSAPLLILTENVPDLEPLEVSAVGPDQVIVNSRRKGFGANHNAAFGRCRTPLFCVMNPDVRLVSDPFPQLLSTLAELDAGAIGPLVRAPSGGVEDSARQFPTPLLLLGKLFGWNVGNVYPTDRGPVQVDWIAGMFMLFSSAAFGAARGFNESYFMYYEDVELCARLRLAGKPIVFEPRANVMHDARRASHRHPRYAWWHATSIARYLCSRTYGELRRVGLA